MKLVKRDTAYIGEDAKIYVKNFLDSTEMITFDKDLYDISKHNKDAVSAKNKSDKNYRKQLKETKQEQYRTINSVIRSKKKMRNIIKSNFGIKHNEFFITLIYNKNKKEERLQRAIIDLGYFTRDLKKLIKKVYTDVKLVYVCSYELHEDVTWHMHIIIRFENMATTLSVDYLQYLMAKIWKKGSAYVSKLNNVKVVASYLCDIYKPNKEYRIYKKQLLMGKVKVDKRFTGHKKYERCFLYPRGVSIFTCSHGLNYTKANKISKSGYEDLVKNKELIMESSNYVLDSEDEIVGGFTRAIHKNI